MKYLIFLSVLIFSISSNCLAQENTGFSVQIMTEYGEQPTIDELEIGSFDFYYTLNGNEIQPNWKSYTIVHLPAKGAIDPPVSCSKGEKWTSPKDYLKTLRLDNGDQLFIEDLVIEFKGKDIKFTTVTLVF